MREHSVDQADRAMKVGFHLLVRFLVAVFIVSASRPPSRPNPLTKRKTYLKDSMAPKTLYPALLIKTSIPPKRFTVSFTTVPHAEA